MCEYIQTEIHPTFARKSALSSMAIVKTRNYAGYSSIYILDANLSNVTWFLKSLYLKDM